MELPHGPDWGLGCAALLLTALALLLLVTR